MASSSSYQSTSSSGSYIPNYPEEQPLLNWAGQDQGYAQQILDWARNAYNNNSQLTDQVVNNYLSGAQSANDLAKSSIDRYQKQYWPIEDQLIADAKNYSSDARKKFEMGAAESGVSQGMDRGLANTIRQLQAHGINPSSGAYVDLLNSTNAARGAAAAGAGTKASRDVEQMGHQRMVDAAAMGQYYPSNIVNEMNAGANDLAGAINSRLANTTVGAKAMQSAQPWAQTAMSLKYPPLGHNSSSQSTRTTQSDNGGGGGQRSNGGPSSYGGFNHPTDSGSSVTPGYDYYGSGASPQILSANGGGSDWATTDPLWGSGGYTDPMNTFTWDTGTNAYNTYDPSSDWTSNYQDYNPYSWDGGMSANGSSGGDWYGGAGAYDSGSNNSWSDGSSASDPSYYTGGTSDWGGGGGTTDTSSYGDSSGGSSWDSGSDWSYAYAGGGAIPDTPTTGGGVPFSASPSAGAQTDDIPANLNAGEFVIPRDVAMWKGQEFFQNLIQKSRMAKDAAPAHGTPGPAAPGPTTFSSGAA